MTHLLPNGRPILAALVCLAMCATGCADAPDGEGDGPVDSCGPLTTRTCDCASGFGPGTSTCLSGGDGWSDCVCLGDASGDASPGDAVPGSGFAPDFRVLSPVTATGDLTSPSYRLRLHVGPPSPSETLVSPNYHLTLGAPAPPE